MMKLLTMLLMVLLVAAGAAANNVVVATADISAVTVAAPLNDASINATAPPTNTEYVATATMTTMAFDTGPPTAQININTSAATKKKENAAT